MSYLKYDVEALRESMREKNCNTALVPMKNGDVVEVYDDGNGLLPIGVYRGEDAIQKQQEALQKKDALRENSDRFRK